TIFGYLRRARVQWEMRRGVGEVQQEWLALVVAVVFFQKPNGIVGDGVGEIIIAFRFDTLVIEEQVFRREVIATSERPIPMIYAAVGRVIALLPIRPAADMPFP